MGKRPKKVQKKQAEEESEEEKQGRTSTKNRNNSEEDFQSVFSASFRERLNKYISLSAEVLHWKAKSEDRDFTDQITQRNQRMGERVEQVATDILRVESTSLQDWIGQQQVKLSEQIVTLSKCYDASRHSLASTGVFSEAEIAQHLKLIQTRSDEKQNAYDTYGQLLCRLGKIYN